MPPKKPKLTPEEKKALRLQRIAEKKRLLVIRKKQLKHDYLEREIKYGALTVKRHEKNWKTMLLNIAVPRMKEDLVYAWHNFERVIDCKDFTISLLMDEIKDSEEQYMTNIRSHVRNIDKIIQMFRDQLEEMREDNDRQLEELKAVAEKEVESMKSNQQHNEEYLKTMLYTLEVARKEQEKTVRVEYLSKVDEESTKFRDLLQRLKVGLEKTFSDLWNLTSNFLNEFNSQTAERRKCYNILREQDDAMQELLKEQLLKIKKFYANIKKLKQRYSDTMESQEQRILDLTHERQFFADAFLTLKSRLEREREVDDANLTLLTVESGNTISYLESLLKKGEKILTIAAICRKLETKKEKILPFPLNPEFTYTLEETPLDFPIKCGNLTLFWRRLAQADALRYSLNEEREHLKRVNFMLKAKIHSFCECVNCPSMPPIVTRRNKNRNINIVDGKLVARNYQKFFKNS